MGYFTNRAKLEFLTRSLSGTQFRMMLVTAGPDDPEAAATFDTVSDVVGNECTFTNYARKDITPTGVVDQDINAGRLLLDNSITWTAAGGAVDNIVAGAWIFRRTTNGTDTPATDSLWLYLVGGNVSTNGEDFIVTPNASGLGTIA